MKSNIGVLLEIWQRCCLQHYNIKNPSRQYEEKSAFQTNTTALFQRPKQTKINKEHLRLVISTIRVGMVAKADDEILSLKYYKNI